jgi:abequosyltransferase
MNKEPILSICIPTFNRAEFLNLTLESIVTQERFKNTNDVEIVISDNCSDDNTEEIANFYTELFGDKVRYFRNEQNIKEKNLVVALSKGRGTFLKLNNDTLKHNSNSLNSIVCTIELNQKNKHVLFFLNQSFNKNDSLLCNDLNDFISQTSYYSTWMGAFGIWKEDFDNLKDFNKHSELLLPQTDVLHRLIADRKRAFVSNDLIFNSEEPKTKGGYDTLTVFLDNYTFILRESLAKGYITTNTYVKEIKRLLLKCLCPALMLILIYPQRYTFSADSKFSRIIAFYRPYPVTIIKFFAKYYVLITYKFFEKNLKTLLNK